MKVRLFSMMRFCLIMIISFGLFYSMDIIVYIIMVLVACPFYVLNNLIMIALKYSDPGGTIQMFTFAGVLGYTIESFLH
jgi:hypothetical protein